MIFDALLNGVSTMINVVFSALPNLPDFDIGLVNSIFKVVDVIFNNLQLLPMFVRVETIQIILPLLIAAINFEHIFDFAMFILRKIPFLGIQ